MARLTLMSGFASVEFLVLSVSLCCDCVFGLLHSFFSFSPVSPASMFAGVAFIVYMHFIQVFDSFKVSCFQCLGFCFNFVYLFVFFSLHFRYVRTFRNFFDRRRASHECKLCIFVISVNQLHRNVYHVRHN